MPTYANEYEGFGNALMNIGSMYYSQEEKKKEEARLRKEKEDERKYLADQSALEWERKAPAEKIKAALAQIRLAQAQASKYTVAGNQLIEQTLVPDETGALQPFESRETLAPLNPYQQRPPSPYRPNAPVQMDGDNGPGLYQQQSPGGPFVFVGKSVAPIGTAATGKLTEKDRLTSLNNIAAQRVKALAILREDDKQAALGVVDQMQANHDKMFPLMEQESADVRAPASDTNTPAPTSGDASKKEAAALSAYAAGNTAVGDAYVAGANDGKANVNIVPQRETPAWKAAYAEGLAAADAAGFKGAKATAYAEAYADQAQD